MSIQKKLTFLKILFLKKKKGVFFCQPAELFPSFSHITFKNLFYVETLLFGCCINTIFHMNKEVFQILWTKI